MGLAVTAPDNPLGLQLRERRRLSTFICLGWNPLGHGPVLIGDDNGFALPNLIDQRAELVFLFPKLRRFSSDDNSLIEAGDQLNLH